LTSSWSSTAAAAGRGQVLATWEGLEFQTHKVCGKEDHTDPICFSESLRGARLVELAMLMWSISTKERGTPVKSRERDKGKVDY
jgi:hypothetical protein